MTQPKPPLSPAAQAVLNAFRAVPDLRDAPSIAAALQAYATRRFRHEAFAVIRHDPSRLPYWPIIVATPEIGSFGRIRWINSEPSEHVWGRIWWSNR